MVFPRDSFRCRSTGASGRLLLRSTPQLVGHPERRRESERARFGEVIVQKRGEDDYVALHAGSPQRCAFRHGRNAVAPRIERLRAR